jgi:hypothetical protein
LTSVSSKHPELGHRITRIRETGVDLFGKAANRWRVIRTSNAYVQ